MRKIIMNSTPLIALAKANKLEILKDIPFDAIFIGDDWKGTQRWTETKESLNARGVEVVFLPYTKNVSSTQLRTQKDDKVDD